jgi:type I restriction enzyme S subunit
MVKFHGLRSRISKILDSTLDSITLLGAKNSATSVIPAGNIIIPTRMALGVAINTIDLAINQDLKALSIKDNNVVDRDYLFRWLESQSSLIESEGKGATVKGITLPFLKGLNVPIPLLMNKNVSLLFLKKSTVYVKNAIEVSNWLMIYCMPYFLICLAILLKIRKDGLLILYLNMVHLEME